MNITKNQLINIILALASGVLIGAILWVALWEFNILKKETPIPQEISKIEQELKYIDELNLIDVLEKLANLNIVPQVLEIPEIKNEEIGKSNLFE
ncbi:MAG: hypothetical protein ACO2O4_04505 [Minisyncoccia bacterium]|jgi:hypothetical protein